ncbi:MAG: L-threonylcarbamoyladenylate synthase [Bacteroidota bacterium]|nr:L-threonylcarbamoyladenylate synthase [Bacteroidota bacterium]
MYNHDDFKTALQTLKDGGVILYPTDTIWGLGCDARNEQAVKKIYEIKKRSNKKSMLVLLNNPGAIQKYVSNMPDIAWDLIDLSEKPLTIIFSNASNLAPNLINEDKTIGIRITKEKFSNKLIESLRKPIVSTSANISNSPSPQNYSEISKDIINAVDYVVKYRQEENIKAMPSSIIKLNQNSEVIIIRE